MDSREDVGVKLISQDILEKCKIAPVEGSVDLNNSSNFKKMKLTKEQQIQIGGLANVLPSLISANTAGNCFYVDLPPGVSINDLMHYADGGVGSIVLGEHGIIGHASFHQITQHPSVVSAFAVISMASNQYFLSQINENLTKISIGIDRILSFLYGEMRAELLAEVNFIKFAQGNYSSIMAHNEQRIATLTSLQRAKKTAVKDIEFYLTNMEEILTNKKGTDISAMVRDLVKGKDCVDLSAQLYVMSNLLEICYSQNFDPDYISFVKTETVDLIGICDKQLLSHFATLQNDIQKAKDWLLGKGTKTEREKLLGGVNDIVEELKSHATSPMVMRMNRTLDEIRREKRYYLNGDGEVYLKVV